MAGLRRGEWKLYTFSEKEVKARGEGKSELLHFRDTLVHHLQF